MPEQAPTIVIHGILNEVGTKYGNQPVVVIKVDSDNGESEFISVEVTKEQAKAFGRHLYGPATITVTAQ